MELRPSLTRFQYPSPKREVTRDQKVINKRMLLIPDFYTRTSGEVICIPIKIDVADAFDRKAFRCSLINLSSMSVVSEDYTTTLTTIMNKVVISQTPVKNNSIVRYTSPIFHEVSSSSSSVKIFEQSDVVLQPIEMRTHVHSELNKPDLTQPITEDLKSESEVWAFLASQPEDRSVFIPNGIILRIPVREILKLYASALPASLVMPRVFYYYDKLSTTRRYITLPNFAYTKLAEPLPPLTLEQIPSAVGRLTLGENDLIPLLEESTDNSSPSMDMTFQVLVIGAAVVFFIALVVGFTLMYWLYANP